MERNCLWWWHRRILVCLLMGLTSFLLQCLTVASINDEGIALLRFKDRIENDPFGALLTWKESKLENDPCSWFGVDCVDGHVVSLHLKNLCLAGTLAPELGHLVHIKWIILRNNSLCGTIPHELGGLKELQVIDLGFNNFSEPLPREWGNNSEVLLLLDNSRQFCQATPDVEQLTRISKVQMEESDLSQFSEASQYIQKLKASCVAVAEHAMAFCYALMRRIHPTKDPMHHRHLREGNGHQSGKKEVAPAPAPAPMSRPRTQNNPPAPSNTVTPAQPPPTPLPKIDVPSASSPPAHSPASDKLRQVIIPIVASIGGFIVFALLVSIFIWRYKKIATVGPWRMGMIGQLQRSYENGDDGIQIINHAITDKEPSEGIPNVERWELEAACEEFSNVTGFSSMGTLYKGTLSTGAEIAVLSYTVKSLKDWTKDMQTQFRNKIDKLSKVNHVNCLNLLSYCEEEDPFTRMLIFEYAPCGTLFEHLHVRESEHLDWAMRLRIMMGVSYCLEYMHNLTPCVTHEHLTAYAVNLTEDYAAKISAFSIWNEVALAARPPPAIIHSTESPEIRPEDNVYSFGVILLEMMTGKIPYSAETGSLDEWVLEYLKGEKPLKDLVDPMLRHYDAAQLEGIGEVIKSCTSRNPHERPGMVEVASRLREITGIAAAGAGPRNYMWWPACEFQSSRSQSQASENT